MEDPKIVKPESWYKAYWIVMGLAFTVLNGILTAFAVRWGVHEGLWDFYLELQRAAAAGLIG